MRSCPQLGYILTLLHPAIFTTALMKSGQPLRVRKVVIRCMYEKQPSAACMKSGQPLHVRKVVIRCMYEKQPSVARMKSGQPLQMKQRCNMKSGKPLHAFFSTTTQCRIMSSRTHAAPSLKLPHTSLVIAFHCFLSIDFHCFIFSTPRNTSVYAIDCRDPIASCRSPYS